ncbi:MAG: YfcE family phosphodiesterase [Haloarculaceae archaeon]
MPRIAVVSDTHIPSRASEIPAWVREEVDAADLVVHAGDFDSPEAYESFRELAPDAVCVTGNMDPGSLGLPTTETFEAGGVRFVVTHGTGDLATYEERVAGIVADHAADRPTVGISGHTHQRADREVDGYRLLNPGSATGADPATETSMFVLEAEGGEVAVEALVE